MPAVPRLLTVLRPMAVGLVLALPSIGEGAEPEPAVDLWTALKDGKVDFSARWRFEFVDQAGIDDSARASNLDLTLGYRTGSFFGVSGYLQFEHVATVGADDYNDTVDPDPRYPVVADPEGTWLNQAWLAYADEERFGDSQAIFGRQLITLDDQRFVGPVGWRLNDQTFDAFTARYAEVENLSLFAAYLWQVNTITGGDLDLDGVLLNAGYTLGDYGTATVFAYLLDYDLGQDSATYGLRFAGDQELPAALTVSYQAGYARQTDYADRDDFAADHLSLRVGLAHGPAKLVIGYESLGSDDGTAAFQTPLATKHAFNGWADKFLVTPPDGLRDVFIALQSKLPAVPGLAGQLAWHSFSATEGGDDYGSELDLQLSYQWEHGLSFGAKAAFYSADDFATDTDKFWLWSQYAF